MPGFFNTSSPNLSGNSVLSRGRSPANLTYDAGALSAQRTAQLQDSLRASQQGFANMFASLQGQGFQPFGFPGGNYANTAPGTEEENMLKRLALTRGGEERLGLRDAVFTPLGGSLPATRGNFGQIFGAPNTTANFNV